MGLCNLFYISWKLTKYQIEKKIEENNLALKKFTKYKHIEFIQQNLKLLKQHFNSICTKTTRESGSLFQGQIGGERYDFAIEQQQLEGQGHFSRVKQGVKDMILLLNVQQQKKERGNSQFVFASKVMG